MSSLFDSDILDPTVKPKRPTLAEVLQGDGPRRFLSAHLYITTQTCACGQQFKHINAVLFRVEIKGTAQWLQSIDRIPILVEHPTLPRFITEREEKLLYCDECFIHI